MRSYFAITGCLLIFSGSALAQMGLTGRRHSFLRSIRKR